MNRSTPPQRQRTPTQPLPESSTSGSAPVPRLDRTSRPIRGPGNGSGPGTPDWMATRSDLSVERQKAPGPSVNGTNGMQPRPHRFTR